MKWYCIELLSAAWDADRSHISPCLFFYLLGILNGWGLPQWIKQKGTNLMPYALFCKYSTETWKRLKQAVKCVRVCVCTQAYSAGMYLCVFYLHSEIVKVDSSSKLHFESDTYRLKGWGSILASDLFVFFSSCICVMLSEKWNQAMQVSAGARENIWLYRSRLLGCWHHQEFSISAQQKIPHLPSPCHRGKWNISLF